MRLFAGGACVALIVLFAGTPSRASAQHHSKIAIVETERAESFAFVDAPDQNHVVLVVTLAGFTDQQWNLLGLSNFALTAGAETYRAETRTVRDLNPASASTLRDLRTAAVIGGPSRVVFIVPRTVSTFDFHYRDEPSIAFTVTGKIHKRVL